MNFGSIQQVLSAPVAGQTITPSSEIRDHIIRGGLNYRFGPPSPAYAADMGVAPAPYRPVVSDVNWSGAYIGANLGYSLARSDTLQTLCAPPTAGGGCLQQERFIVSPAGFVGGGQVGYNWQFTPTWVFGVEADAQGSGQRDTACVFLCIVNPGNGGLVNSTIVQTIDWFATLRARAGISQNGWLLYVTGGGAMADIKTDASVNLNGLAPGTLAAGTFHDLKSGGVVGAGAEVALSGGWSAKAEYLYMDFGTFQHTVNVPNAGTTLPSVTSSELVDHVIRGGVNYRFGG
jgi:outer membrane immunogenic protein